MKIDKLNYTEYTLERYWAVEPYEARLQIEESVYEEAGRITVRIPPYVREVIERIVEVGDSYDISNFVIDSIMMSIENYRNATVSQLNKFETNPQFFELEGKDLMEDYERVTAKKDKTRKEIKPHYKRTAVTFNTGNE